MRFSRFVAFALCVPLSLLIVFSGGSINASAAVVKKSAADMRSFYGDYINIDYDYEGVTYSTSASYYGTVSRYQYQSIDSNAIIPSVSSLSNYDIILYSASVPASNWMYPNVVVDGLYTRFDGYARGGFVGSLIGLGYNIPVNDARNSSTNWPENYCGDIPATMSTTSGYYGYFSCALSPDSGEYVSFRMIQYEFQDGGVTEEVHFDGLRSDSRSRIFIGVICPYVDGDISNSPAETTVTTSPSDVNVNVDVNVDMTETNGILGDIADILSGLVSGIQGLFVPSEQWLDDWLQAMADALEDAFGDIPALHDQLETAIQNLINNSAVQTLHFDGVSPPGVGQVIAPRDVPLKPSGFESLYSFVRIAVNLVATIAVINMLLNKFKAVLVGEVVVDHGD